MRRQQPLGHVNRPLKQGDAVEQAVTLFTRRHCLYFGLQLSHLRGPFG